MENWSDEDKMIDKDHPKEVVVAKARLLRANPGIAGVLRIGEDRLCVDNFGNDGCVDLDF